MKKLNTIFIITFLFFQTTLFSQPEEKNNYLNGKSTIYINSGFKIDSKSVARVYYDGVEAKSGFTGSIAYAYWFENEWSINFQCGVFTADAKTSFSNVTAKSVIPILFGVKYYPKLLSLGDVGRVYCGVNLGTYTGVSTRVSAWIWSETTTETIFGFQPNAGIDLFVASWLKIGPSISYHKLGDFSEIIDVKNNYSGFEYSISFGIVF